MILAYQVVKRTRSVYNQSNNNSMLIHPSKFFCNNNGSNAPTIQVLQLHLRNSWLFGFDTEGANHYQKQLQKKDNQLMLSTKIENRNKEGTSILKSWLGAAEVCSLLCYFTINATVVQFVKTKQSRKMLGWFVWEYFTQKSSTSTSTLLYLAQQSFHTQHIDFNKRSGIQCSSTSSCCYDVERCPLYLQWEGHSVTVVGIECCSYKDPNSVSLSCASFPKDTTRDAPTNQNSKNQHFIFNLIIFDPRKNGSVLKKNLESFLQKPSSLNVQDLTKTKNYFNDSNNLKSRVQLSCNNLETRDCQIVHCSDQPISVDEIFKGRRSVRGVTA